MQRTKIIKPMGVTLEIPTAEYEDRNVSYYVEADSFADAELIAKEKLLPQYPTGTMLKQVSHIAHDFCILHGIVKLEDATFSRVVMTAINDGEKRKAHLIMAAQNTAQLHAMIEEYMREEFGPDQAICSIHIFRTEYKGLITKN